VDEDVEGRGTGNDPEGSCRTTIVGVVGGTCASQKWPCRLLVEVRRRCSKQGKKNLAV
jgi:hypothetical protein